MKQQKKETSTLRGKCALVSGASRGIGRAIALAMARAEVDVGLLARSRPELELTADEIESLGQKAVVLVADVRVPGDITAAVCQTVKELGRIDILVNNAGIAGPCGKVEDIGDDDWVDTCSTNLTGAFYLCRAVVPIMKGCPPGTIINIVGGTHIPEYLAYSASKAGLIGFSQALSKSLASSGVTVNTLGPAHHVTTQMTTNGWSRKPGTDWLAPDAVAADVVELAVLGLQGLNGESLVSFGCGHLRRFPRETRLSLKELTR